MAHFCSFLRHFIECHTVCSGKRSILPFFFLGFFVVKIFGVSALQLACLGVPMIVAVVLMSKEAEENTVKRALQSGCGSMASDDDDDD